MANSFGGELDSISIDQLAGGYDPQDPYRNGPQDPFQHDPQESFRSERPGLPRSHYGSEPLGMRSDHFQNYPELDSNDIGNEYQYGGARGAAHHGARHLPLPGERYDYTERFDRVVQPYVTPYGKGNRVTADPLAARTPARMRQRVLDQFTSQENVDYLRGVFAKIVQDGRLKEFALATLYDAVLGYERAEDIVYSDPLAQRGENRSAVGFWHEVSRLNRAFVADRMNFFRDHAALITGRKFGVDGGVHERDDEPYHMRMFIADSLRPPGLEHFNNGPLWADEEDRTFQTKRPYAAYAAKGPGGGPLYGDGVMNVGRAAGNRTAVVRQSARTMHGDRAQRSRFGGPGRGQPSLVQKEGMDNLMDELMLENLGMEDRGLLGPGAPDPEAFSSNPGYPESGGHPGFESYSARHHSVAGSNGLPRGAFDTKKEGLGHFADFSGGGMPDPGTDSADWAWDRGDANRTAEQAVAEYWGEGYEEDTMLGSKEVGGWSEGDFYAWGAAPEHVPSNGASNYAPFGSGAPQIQYGQIGWDERNGSEFMRYRSIPFWQNLSRGRDGYDRDIEETLGSGDREMDNHVRRWDMSRLRSPRGEEYRRYGQRSGYVV